ncbi:hypothetical protein MD484_g6411, partial [Candolleomyces efflorescens]
MSRSRKKPRNGKSKRQLEALAQGRKSRRTPRTQFTAPALVSRQNLTIHELQKNLIHYKKQFEAYKSRYYNERKRNARLTKANEQMKARQKLVQIEATRLRGMLERGESKARKVEQEMRSQIARLWERIVGLEASRKELVRDRTVIRKRTQRLLSAKRALERRVSALKKVKPAHTYRLMRKGVYTRQARSLARYLAATGMAEEKIGKALNEVSAMLGVKLDHTMSKRTVQRCILEGGIAADLQLAYEMAKVSKLCFSSDSTSHRHIEYESRQIAMQVIDYSNPDADPTWQMRSLGVGTSVDHSSETQVAGLRKRLEELAALFNDSPLSKRTGIRFYPDDFAYKLIGTSGDHAADQKKSHRALEEWKKSVVYQRLGEEALFSSNNLQVVALLLGLKAQQIQLVGGQEAWDRLTEDEKAAAHSVVVREVGKQVFENLPQDDQNRLSRFIRTGCCMHKDLNCFKGGDKRMQEMWGSKCRTPPVLLANKENAGVIAGVRDGEALNADQTRALEASKRGGSKAAELGGMICNNKDTKKGQQDSYKFWMNLHNGYDVPYPDVSNTRYGSHGEAAATILMHRDAFILFMQHVHDSKERPGHTNVEKNFTSALTDIPTLTELAVLAVYHVAVSRPFMSYVRRHPNILDLEDFFKQKTDLLDRVIGQPTLWTTPGAAHRDIFVDGGKPDERAIEVFKAIHDLAPKLPDLDDAVIAFASGARDTFVERFSDEFKSGNGIDSLTADERKELFFPSTNDANEGALGAWRLAQRRRVSETLHKFNSSKQALSNGTEDFIIHILTEEEDHQHLRRSARDRDESKLQDAIKRAQIEANNAKVAINRAKEAKREANRKKREMELSETARNLVLDDAEIAGLSVDAINMQLNFHRDAEKDLDIPKEDRVPAKSKMGSQKVRIEQLKKAVARYKARSGEPEAALVAGPSSFSGFDDNYEDDYFDDHS